MKTKASNFQANKVFTYVKNKNIAKGLIRKTRLTLSTENSGYIITASFYVVVLND